MPAQVTRTGAEAVGAVDTRDIEAYMTRLGEAARAAATAMRRTPTAAKNAALLAMAERLQAARAELLALSPASYTGLAAGLAKDIAQSV